jgi:uncharacterized protein
VTTKRENPKGLAASIVAFCRFARSHGLPVGMHQTLAALEAANVVGFTDWQRFSYAVRAALCSSHEDWQQFDQLFNAFWNSPRSHPDSAKDQGPRKQATRKQSADSRLLITAESGDAASQESEGKLVSGASSQQRLKQVDFSQASHADMAALEQLSLRLLRQMSVRLSRRMKIEAQADSVDLRRSIRRNISHGGDPIRLAFKGRKPQKKRLTIFLDISGSMNLYSLFLLRFAYALQKHFKRVGHLPLQHKRSGSQQPAPCAQAIGGAEQAFAASSGMVRRHEDWRIAARIQPARRPKNSFAQHLFYHSE